MRLRPVKLLLVLLLWIFEWWLGEVMKSSVGLRGLVWGKLARAI